MSEIHDKLQPWLKIYRFVYEKDAEIVDFEPQCDGGLKVIRVAEMQKVGGVQHLNQGQKLMAHIGALGFHSKDESHIHQVPTPAMYNARLDTLVGKEFGLRAKFAYIDSLRLAPEETLKMLQEGILPVPIPTEGFVDSLTLDKSNDQWKMLIDHVNAPIHDLSVYGINFHYLPRSILKEVSARIDAARTETGALEIPPSMLLAFYRQTLNEFCQDIWCRIESPEQFPAAAEKSLSHLWTQLDEKLAQAKRILDAAEKNQASEAEDDEKDTKSDAKGKIKGKNPTASNSTKTNPVALKRQQAFRKAGLEPWSRLYRFIYGKEARILRLKNHETEDAPKLQALLCPEAENLGGFDQLGQVPNLIEHVYHLGFGSHDGKRLDQMPTFETFQFLHKQKVGEGFGPDIFKVDSPLRRIHIEDRVEAYTGGRFPLLFTSEEFFRSVALTKSDDRWTVLRAHVEQPLVDLSVHIVNFHYVPKEIWISIGDKFRDAVENAAAGKRLNLEPIVAFYHKDFHDICHQIWSKTKKAENFPELARDKLAEIEAAQDARIKEAIATAHDLSENSKSENEHWYDDAEMRPFSTYEEASPLVPKTGKSRPSATLKAAPNAENTPPPKTSPKRAKAEHWSDIIRKRLTDMPNRALRMSELMPKEEIPQWGCILPWTRLELGMDQQYGPCCTAYQVQPGRWSKTSNLEALWNGPGMRQFRKALTSDNPYGTCRKTCPVLEGGGHLAPSLELRGGPEFFIEAQIRLVEDLMSGAEHMRSGPLEICFPTTTYCNYDCLMCPYGEIGTLEDELPASFYEQLAKLIPGMYLIEALGGEPLASKVFRDFLAGFDFPSHPHIRMSLITNGSYLTPKEQKRLAHVPFTNLTCSINAATPDSYLKVNQGLPWERTRENLDELLKRRHEGEFGGAITYSMVLLKSNYHEVRQFAELARKDGVQFRYMLTMHNRNDESIMTAPEIMKAVLADLEVTAQEEWKRGQWHAARQMLGEARVLKRRLDRGIFRPIPDDESEGGSKTTEAEAGKPGELTPLAPNFAEREKKLTAAQKTFGRGPKTK